MVPRGRRKNSKEKARERKKKRKNGRNRKTKGREKKSMHLRASATLNILMAQYHRQCYRGGSVHTYAANRNPFFFFFFLDCSSIPKLVRATMRRCPASNPYPLPFLRGHTPRVENRVQGVTERGNRIGSERKFSDEISYLFLISATCSFHRFSFY